MNEENKNTPENAPVNTPKKRNVDLKEMLYALIAIGLIVLGGVALGVSFTPLGIYALIASMLFEIAAMTFVNLQKRKKDFKWLLYVRIAAYVVFAAALIVFVGGTIWAS